MNVMIVGGTSGIGLALAKHYLAQGARVSVCGRDLARMDASAAAHVGAQAGAHMDGQAMAAAARLHGYQLDIADRQALAAAIDDVCLAGPLDLLIVCAGRYAGADELASQPALGLEMLRTNVVGLNHAFDLAAEKMTSQGGGQLAAIASVAGLLKDYPGASFYSANKRTVMLLCDTWRKALAPLGIAVTVLVPGYIDTAKLRELNQGDASAKPFLLSEQDAVRRMTQALAARADRAVFPWQLHCLVRLFNLLPLQLRRIRKK